MGEEARAAEAGLEAVPAPALVPVRAPRRRTTIQSPILTGPRCIEAHPAQAREIQAPAEVPVAQAPHRLRRPLRMVPRCTRRPQATVRATQAPAPARGAQPQAPQPPPRRPQTQALILIGPRFIEAHQAIARAQRPPARPRAQTLLRCTDGTPAEAATPVQAARNRIVDRPTILTAPCCTRRGKCRRRRAAIQSPKLILTGPRSSAADPAARRLTWFQAWLACPRMWSRPWRSPMPRRIQSIPGPIPGPVPTTKRR